MSDISTIKAELDRRELAEQSPYALATQAIKLAAEGAVSGRLNRLDLPEVKVAGATLYPLHSAVYGDSPIRSLAVSDGELLCNYTHGSEPHEAVGVYGAVWPRAHEVAVYVVGRDITIPDQQERVSIEEAFDMRQCADGLYLASRATGNVGYSIDMQNTVEVLQDEALYNPKTTKEVDIKLGGPIRVTSVPNYLRVTNDQLQQPIAPRKPLEINLPEELSKFTVTIPSSADKIVVKEGQFVAMDRYRESAVNMMRPLQDLQIEAKRRVGGPLSPIDDTLYFQFGLHIVDLPELNDPRIHSILADSLSWQEISEEQISNNRMFRAAALPSYKTNSTKATAREAVLSALNDPESHIRPAAIGSVDTVNYLASPLRASKRFPRNMLDLY